MTKTRARAVRRPRLLAGLAAIRAVLRQFEGERHEKFGKVIVAVLFASFGFVAVFVASSGPAAAEPPDSCFHDSFDGFLGAGFG
jgi:hypothetical protein